MSLEAKRPRTEDGGVEASPAAQARHVEELYRQQRLLLVLDIDNTLLESCNDASLLNAFQNEPQVSTMLSQLPGFSSFSIGVATPNKQKSTYLIKLRDGAQTFLQEMMQFFEVYIYTKGVRTYANTAMSLLAPNDGFPPKRIFCRDDEIARDPNAGPDVKTLAYLFSSHIMQAMTVVVDDRADVWSRHRDQLAWAWPFKFFTSRTKPRKPVKPGDSATFDPADPKAISDWCTSLETLLEDNVLSNLSRVLKLVHQQFFAPSNLSPGPALHVDQLLRRVKASVLAGQHIVFSGLFPLHEGQQPSDLAQELWNLASEFGAGCYKEMVDQVTHVVGARPGSAKMHQAAQMPGVYVVHYTWLQYSAAHYTRADEYDFSFTDSRWETFFLAGKMGFHAALSMKSLADQVAKLDTKTAPPKTSPLLPLSLTNTNEIKAAQTPLLPASPTKTSKKKKSMQKWAQSLAAKGDSEIKSGEPNSAVKRRKGSHKSNSPKGGSAGGNGARSNSSDGRLNSNGGRSVDGAATNTQSCVCESGSKSIDNSSSSVVAKAAPAVSGWRAGGGRRRNTPAAPLPPTPDSIQKPILLPKIHDKKSPTLSAKPSPKARIKRPHSPPPITALAQANPTTSTLPRPAGSNWKVLPKNPVLKRANILPAANPAKKFPTSALEVEESEEGEVSADEG